MQVAKNTVVAIDYVLTGPEGEVLDSSEGREPLAYLHGNGNIIPGLEQALEGHAEGDKLDVTVKPEEGYGQRDDALLQTVTRDMFEGADKIEPGMRFNAMSNHGPRIVTVTEVEGDNITVDANHPLAGVTLQFAVEIKDVREASDEELEHGHVHTSDEHDHE